MTTSENNDACVVVHHAGTATEAVVIRSLLESAGIASPGSGQPDMFPMREPPEGFDDATIVALESQADDARRIIAEYLASATTAEPESADGEEEESGEAATSGA